MRKTVAFASAAVAAISLAVAAPAMAQNPILTADTAATNTGIVGYDSNGTFSGVSDILANLCAATTGQQTVNPAQGLSVTVCQPASSTQPAEPLPQADWSILGLPVTGIDTNITYDAIADACDTVPSLAGLAGVTLTPSATVTVAPGLSVGVCANAP